MLGSRCDGSMAENEVTGLIASCGGRIQMGVEWKNTCALCFGCKLQNPRRSQLVCRLPLLTSLMTNYAASKKLTPQYSFLIFNLRGSQLWQRLIQKLHSSLLHILATEGASWMPHNWCHEMHFAPLDGLSTWKNHECNWSLGRLNTVNPLIRNTIAECHLRHRTSPIL